MQAAHAQAYTFPISPSQPINTADIEGAKSRVASLPNLNDNIRSKAIEYYDLTLEMLQRSSEIATQSTALISSNSYLY